MPISIPPSPSTNDPYSFGDRAWTFNGTGWVRVRVTNTFMSPNPVSDYREQIPGIAPMAISVAFIPTEITYI